MQAEAIYIIGLLAGLVVFIVGCVILSLKIQRHISKEFEIHRKLMYSMFKERDRSIRTLQFWAIRQGGKDPYQPAVEPLELLAADQLKKDSNDNGNEAH